MSRAWVCGIIIAVMAVSSVILLKVLESSTERVEELIDRVIVSAEGGEAESAEEAIGELEEYWREHCMKLSCTVHTTDLSDITYAVAKLRGLYRSGADDLIAECEGIKAAVGLIVEMQEPRLQAIL